MGLQQKLEVTHRDVGQPVGHFLLVDDSNISTVAVLRPSNPLYLHHPDEMVSTVLPGSSRRLSHDLEGSCYQNRDPDEFDSTFWWFWSL